MAGQVDRHPGQSTLSMRCAKYTTTCNETYGCSRYRLVLSLVNDLPDGRVVGHEEFIARLFRETLSTIPSHVVNCHECPIGDEEIIQQSTANNDVVCALDDRWKGRKGGWVREVAVWEERVIATDSVLCWWRVDGFLDFAVVEVVVWTLSEGRESELIPEEGAKICKMVDIEARVDVDCGTDDVVPYGTSWRGGIGCSEFASWWEGQGFFHELEVATLLSSLVDLGHEGLVKREHIGIVVQVGDRRCYVESVWQTRSQP